MMPLDGIRTKAERLEGEDAALACRDRGVVHPAVDHGRIGGVETDGDLGKGRRSADHGGAGIYIAYRYRKWRLAAPPVALGRTNCLEFYRAELVRQRDLSKDSSSYLLPFVPGLALSVFGGGLEGRPSSQLIAIIVHGVALFLGVAWWNEHTARKLQNEIDALDAS